MEEGYQYRYGCTEDLGCKPGRELDCLQKL